jgi:hypothetical protein
LEFSLIKTEWLNNLFIVSQLQMGLKVKNGGVGQSKSNISKKDLGIPN